MFQICALLILFIILILIISYVFYENKTIGGMVTNMITLTPESKNIISELPKTDIVVEWPKEYADSINKKFNKYFYSNINIETGPIFDVTDSISQLQFASPDVITELRDLEFCSYNCGGITIVTNKPEIIKWVYALHNTLLSPGTRITYYMLLSSKKKTVGNRNINSAEFHYNNNNLFVFRKEECIKTLIHEMMHVKFGRQFKGHHDEAIVETMAQFINCAIGNEDWAHEINFGLYQSQKILNIFGKNTSAYEYHVLSTIYKINLQAFLTAVETKNLNFFDTHFPNPATNPTINTTSPTKNSILSETLRMSAIEYKL